MGALLFALLLFWFALYKGAGLHRSSIASLGYDVGAGSPQAQNLRVILADLDNSVVRLLLISPHEQQGSAVLKARADYTKLRARLSAYLTRALGRAALAEASATDKRESNALARLQNEVGAYDALVSRALTLHAWDDRPQTQSEALIAYRQAQQQLDTTLLGAADELSQSRKSTFEDTDNRQNNARDLMSLVIGALASLLLIALITLQFALFSRTHRLLNPGLVMATLLSLVLGWWANATFTFTEDQITRAQEGRYRLLDLGRMRALASLSHNSEGRLLLLARDGVTRKQETAVFHQKMTAVPDLISSAGGSSGHILRQCLTNYTQAHFALLDQIKNGQREAAIRSYLQTGEQNSRAPFNTFQRAIGVEFADAQSSVDSAIAQGTAQLRYHELLTSLLALAIATVTIMGIRPRFKEYMD